jgi:hypothetical protein
VDVRLARQISFRRTAHEAQKVAYNRSWDDIDWESTFEHRRENGLIRRKSGSRSRDYEGSEFGEPEHIGSTPTTSSTRRSGFI